MPHATQRTFDLYLTIPCRPNGTDDGQEFGILLHMERVTRNGVRLCYGADYFSTPEAALRRADRSERRDGSPFNASGVLVASAIAGATIGMIHNQRGRLTWDQFGKLDFESVCNQAVEAVDAFNRKQRKPGHATSASRRA